MKIKSINIFKFIGIFFIVLFLCTAVKPSEAEAQASDIYWNSSEPCFEGWVQGYYWASGATLHASFGTFNFDNGWSGYPDWYSFECAEQKAYGGLNGAWPEGSGNCRFKYFYNQNYCIIDTTGMANRPNNLPGSTWPDIDKTQRVFVSCSFPEYPVETDKTIIVSYYGTDGWWEDGGNSVEWLYYNGKTSGSYYHKTDPNVTVDTANLIASPWTIHKKDWYRAGQYLRTDWWIDYREQLKKTITYDYSSTITQTKYSPYNLNRNGLATTSDISKDWVGQTALDVSVNNMQKITDGSALPSLDINSDNQFTFKFNNSVFGMPTSLDWSTKVPSIGTYENVNSSAYCNGRRSSNSDGNYRYNLKFKASTSLLSTDFPTSSLTFDSKEVVGNEEFSRDCQGNDSTFRGGDWSTRFSYIGNYNLDNEKSSNFKNWWINTYQQSKFFEYGTEYWGNIDVNNIYDPRTITYGEGKSEGGVYKIHTDTDKGQELSLKNINGVPNAYRGFYIKEASQTFEQPVLTGKWKVESVAGAEDF